MRVIIVIAAALLISLIACDKKETEAYVFKNIITDSTTMEEDEAFLSNLYLEILALSNSVSCTDPDEWKATALGAKACGGPQEYIAYNIKIDVELFLAKVTHFTNQQSLFNSKWGIMSDCSIPPAPSRIICENNKPVFYY
mgnify:CR=1 FL=1